MKLLTPLGLLGLLGLLVLLLIYLLKPNYQQKMVSSTYVWKRSLRYRKRKLPISKLRNILIIICQVLILTACAFILAQPFIKKEVPPEITEKAAVIDASAAMRVKGDQETRFERAVEQVKVLSEETFKNDGIMTVVMAGAKAETLAFRFRQADAEELFEILDELVANKSCTYGNADIDGAIKLAGEVLTENPYADIVLYTSNTYIDNANIEVVNVSEETEWNAAILDCRAKLEENYYTFSIDVACYGRSERLTVTAEVYGTNNDGDTIQLISEPVYCENGVTQTVVFKPSEKQSEKVKNIFKFDSVFVRLNEVDDDLSEDNIFYLYGGTEETIRVQYYSTKPNTFFANVLMVLRDGMRGRWRLEISEVRKGSPELSGFDFYIFEHEVPSELPKDGLVLLVNPSVPPKDSGLTIGKEVSGDFNLAFGEKHEITQYMMPEMMRVSTYRQMEYSEEFKPLLYCGNDPVFVVKNTRASRLAVMSFSLNNADTSMEINFPILITNLFNYFIPSTATVTKVVDGAEEKVPQYVFDVNETVCINTRGTNLSLSLSGEGAVEKDYEFEEIPFEIALSACGTYTIRQTLLSGTVVVSNIYVKMPSDQSNIFRTVDALEGVAAKAPDREEDKDLVVYVAAALIALMFIEWWLQSREHF